MKMDIRGLVCEWLGESSRSGNRDWWLCPFHDERTPSFTLTPSGTHYHCFGCGEHGDAIDFLKGMEPALSFRECVDRLGAGELVSSSPRRNPRAKPAPPPPRRGVRWVDEMELVARTAADALRSKAGAKARTWLHSRGLTMDAILGAGLGLIASDLRVVTGVEPETGEEQEVWIPRGIAIPWRSPTGEVDLLNVRRPTGSPKYIAVTGSRRGGVFPSPDRVLLGRPLVICEGELDAILVAASLPGGAAAVTLGGASADPAGQSLAAISRAATWILAVDSDQAGERLVQRWSQRWPRRVQRVAPPAGCKDWTEAWEAGHDLAEFWAATLPPPPAGADETCVEQILSLLRIGADPLRAIENTAPEDLPTSEVLQASLDVARRRFAASKEAAEAGKE